jgi:hypothetical protein
MVLVALLAAGCKNNRNAMPDMSNGHELVGCTTAMDCDDGLRCHTWKCNSVTRTCGYKDNCLSDACNIGKCDEAHNTTCGVVPTNEGGSCRTIMGTAGSGTSGTCEPLPTCFDPSMLLDGASLYCDSGSLAWEEASTDPADSIQLPTNNVSSYSCAPTEGAPEVAYQLGLPAGSDTDVTVRPREPTVASWIRISTSSSSRAPVTPGPSV